LDVLDGVPSNLVHGIVIPNFGVHFDQAVGGFAPSEKTSWVRLLFDFLIDIY